jgi:hypothetical protein
VITPGIYIALFLLIRLGRVRAETFAERKARGAYRVFIRSIEGCSSEHGTADPAALLAALKAYLGAKTGLSSGSMTFTDITPVLRRRGVPETTINDLRDIFDECEAGRYGGYGGVTESGLPARMIVVVKKMEEALR